MRKKTCYLFIFDGFSECETSYATIGISRSHYYEVKTIAIRKTEKKSMGGMSVLPDFDFFPDVDLDDINSGNTAMLILPGGVCEYEETSGIMPLVEHCIGNNIPVRDGNLSTASGTTPIEFARDVFECLGIEEEESVNSWFRSFDRVTV